MFSTLQKSACPRRIRPGANPSSAISRYKKTTIGRYDDERNTIIESWRPANFNDRKWTDKNKNRWTVHRTNVHVDVSGIYRWEELKRSESNILDTIIYRARLWVSTWTFVQQHPSLIGSFLIVDVLYLKELFLIFCGLYKLVRRIGRNDFILLLPYFRAICVRSVRVGPFSLLIDRPFPSLPFILVPGLSFRLRLV